MPLGPGKYDALATQAIQEAGAQGVILVVFNGKFGHGFSVQATAEITAVLPRVLRDIAQQIEDSIPRA